MRAKYKITAASITPEMTVGMTIALTSTFFGSAAIGDASIYGISIELTIEHTTNNKTSAHDMFAKFDCILIA